MRNRMQAAIIKKDLKSLVCNRRLFPVLLVVPLIFTVILPTILILTLRFAPDGLNGMDQLLMLLPEHGQGGDLGLQIIALIFHHVLPIFFIIIPIMAATVMAASSFVGEKEKRTLETLLYSPLRVTELFRAKILGCFALSMAVSFGSFLVMMAAVELELFFVYGSLIIPGVNWVITLLLVSPSVSLMAITLIVGGSAKAQSVEEAQQRAVFLILPLLLLIVGQFTGVLLVSGWVLLGLGAVFAALALLLLRGSARRFDYETLLK